jgi:hypothetical protein
MEIKVINPLRDDVQREYRKDNHYEVCREVTHVVVGLEVLWLKFGTGREEIDPSQVEAVTATGASRAQQLSFGIIPQILPAFAGISVFRWDINIRESTVLGLVGAGGIGVGAGWCRRYRFAAGFVHIHTFLDPGIPDIDRHSLYGYCQRMGVSQDSASHDLITRRFILAR